MGKFENAYARFMANPVPKDIKPEEVIYMAKRLGFPVTSGGKHPIKIINPRTKEVMPIPVKKGIVQFPYIHQLQKWFKQKEEEK